jgi:hypothetical protein
MAPAQTVVARTIAAIALALTAFALYRATLLPGFDLGDTASFQSEISLEPLTPRHGYPLYLTIGRWAVGAIGGDPARALNLVSAAAAAVACGVTVIAAGSLAKSVIGGLFAGWLLAASYTFWSQAIIAEVYALHVLFVATCTAALLWWERRQSLPRLTVFLALYALSFGHHLSMILLAPSFGLFLAAAARDHWRAVFGLKPIAFALGIAAVASLQYLTSLQSLWFAPVPPASLGEGLRTFWFDVTKADWRESMVLAVDRSTMTDRLAMLAFDVRQQFGVVGAALAIAGLFTLRARSARVLLVTAYLVPAAFALGYNVGDVHVFFLTSHFVTALLAGCGVGAIERSLGEDRSRARIGMLLASALLLYPAWRTWDTLPAVDRSADRRPARTLDGFTAGLSDRTVLGADLNWQLQNGLRYYAYHHKPGLPFVRTAEHMVQAPFLIHDNLSIGREVVVSEGSRARLVAAFGPRYEIVRDTRVATPSLSGTVGSISVGTLYVLNVLMPTRDYLPLPVEIGSELRVLTGGAVSELPPHAYVTIIGRAGEHPVLVAAADRPYRRRQIVGTVNLDVRMESWLSTDTIRRAGFGHVIANRRHVLIVERGISLVALDERGGALEVFYSNNIFEALPRYVLRRRL